MIEYICSGCGTKGTSIRHNRRFCSICIPDQFARNRYTRFKITEPEYQAMFASQGGRCGICARELVHGKKPKLQNFACIDHDHKTMQIRGLLCPGCNTKLGHMEDLEWTRRAKLYLERQ